MYRNLTLSVSLLAFLTAAAVHARTPQVHRLEATPATIAYGYYWSEAPPALRIASGDVIDVDTTTDQHARRAGEDRGTRRSHPNLAQGNRQSGDW